MDVADVLPGRGMSGRKPDPGLVRRIAVRVAGGIAALEPDLVRPAASECLVVEEEALVERHATAIGHVQLDQTRLESRLTSTFCGPPGSGWSGRAG